MDTRITEEATGVDTIIMAQITIISMEEVDLDKDFSSMRSRILSIKMTLILGTTTLCLTIKMIINISRNNSIKTTIDIKGSVQIKSKCIISTEMMDHQTIAIEEAFRLIEAIFTIRTRRTSEIRGRVIQINTTRITALME